ncbi:Protein kinase domain-containing protein [Mycena indigotica]|uniref:Protein kinase domain-containing protein n=1 Tax=Mycena indigotica TaxID=2126181 RepID=A0A8H6T718_9AGAR|nr:Protein kinase domain-containing protein [Mycena indigotica]KAF7312090.1 Protein kinase domain-containing protein [Mycena indigotica]
MPFTPMIIVVISGLTTHALFNRIEPRTAPAFAALLLLPPLLLFCLIPLTLVSILAFYLALSASVILYRISPFHPLASYPGPFIARISKLWLAAIAMSGKQHVYYRDLHRRYGDVVRVGPNELSFASTSAITPMLGTKGMPKSSWWDGRMPENKNVRSLLALRDPEEHSRRRRIWNRAFSTIALKEYDSVVRNRLAQLGEALNENCGKTVDLSQWLGRFTYDVMNDIVFGGGVELMRDGDKDGLYAMFEAFLPMALLMGHLPWLGELTTWIPGFARGVKKFRAFAISCAIGRKTHGSPRKDIFYHLIDEAGLESEPPSLAQVISDSSPAIAAGAETTSTALSNLFWLLLCNPLTYSRLQAELNSVHEDLLDCETQKRMVYLNACINETLRLYPGVLSGSERAPLIGSGGHAIGSHFVPEGTGAVVHSYTLQRDPRYFSPSPDSFIPERWLSIEEQRGLKPAVFKSTDEIIHDQFAFIPFSFGPANCAGKQLAYQQMRMVICTLMSRFELRFEDGYDARLWEDNLCDYFIARKGELPVVLSHRQ